MCNRQKQQPFGYGFFLSAHRSKLETHVTNWNEQTSLILDIKY